jgi:hypothetical protein
MNQMLFPKKKKTLSYFNSPFFQFFIFHISSNEMVVLFYIRRISNGEFLFFILHKRLPFLRKKKKNNNNFKNSKQWIKKEKKARLMKEKKAKKNFPPKAFE